MLYLKARTCGIRLGIKALSGYHVFGCHLHGAISGKVLSNKGKPYVQ